MQIGGGFLYVAATNCFICVPVYDMLVVIHRFGFVNLKLIMMTLTIGTNHGCLA